MAILALYGLLATLVFDTLIAWVITSLTDYHFWQNWLVSNIFGLAFYSWSLVWTIFLGKDKVFKIMLLSFPTGLSTALLILSQLFPSHLTSEFASSGVFFGLIAFIIGGIYTRQQMTRLQLTEQKLALKQAQMQQLQSQIEPHFLFNTLAHIQASIRHEPDKALSLLEHLTQLMRLSLQREKQNTPKLKISLGEEIDGLRHYIAIQQMRLEERLTVHWQIEEACLDLPVPPLLLQPLVENAVIHGIEPLEDGGTLLISATCEQQQLTLIIKDTGMGMSTNQQESGLGLSNLKKRLALEYDDQAELSVISSPEGVEIKLNLNTTQHNEYTTKEAD